MFALIHWRNQTTTLPTLGSASEALLIGTGFRRPFAFKKTKVTPLRMVSNVHIFGLRHSSQSTERKDYAIMYFLLTMQLFQQSQVDFPLIYTCNHRTQKTKKGFLVITMTLKVNPWDCTSPLDEAPWTRSEKSSRKERSWLFEKKPASVMLFGLTKPKGIGN